jgi:hypothetical protein
LRLRNETTDTPLAAEVASIARDKTLRSATAGAEADKPSRAVQRYRGPRNPRREEGGKTNMSAPNSCIDPRQMRN